MFSCKNSLNPIHWHGQSSFSLLLALQKMAQLGAQKGKQSLTRLATFAAGDARGCWRSYFLGFAMVFQIPTNIQYVTYNNSQKGSKNRHLASNEFFRIFHLWQLRNLFGLFGKAKHWLVNWDKIAGRCFSYFQCGPHPTTFTPSYSHDDHAGITLFLHRIYEMFMIVLLSAFLRAILCTL